jgi:uncharacterized membrane protein
MRGCGKWGGNVGGNVKLVFLGEWLSFVPSAFVQMCGGAQRAWSFGWDWARGNVYRKRKPRGLG